MNNNELKIMVPNGWVINEEVMADGSRMLVIKPNTTTVENTSCHMREGIFKKVPASELSLEDDFLKYTPKTEEEKKFKREVKKVIKAGVHDFWRPVCDPSIDDKGCICYEPGQMPCLDKSYMWWVDNAKKYAPEHGSRLGTKFQYIAFLAVLIKELVASGKSVEWAWDAVCNDSKELGHYWNSNEAKLDNEPTGSREICGYCDLANNYKVLARNKKDGRVWVLEVVYDERGNDCPLSNLKLLERYEHCDCDVFELDDYDFTGWLVFDSCPC